MLIRLTLKAKNCSDTLFTPFLLPYCSLRANCEECGKDEETWKDRAGNKLWVDKIMGCELLDVEWNFERSGKRLEVNYNVSGRN